MNLLNQNLVIVSETFLFNYLHLYNFKFITKDFLLLESFNIRNYGFDLLSRIQSSLNINKGIESFQLFFEYYILSLFHLKCFSCLGQFNSLANFNFGPFYHQLFPYCFIILFVNI